MKASWFAFYCYYFWILLGIPPWNIDHSDQCPMEYHHYVHSLKIHLPVTIKNKFRVQLIMPTFLQMHQLICSEWQQKYTNNYSFQWSISAGNFHQYISPTVFTSYRNRKVQCKEVKNTTSLLSINSVVNRMACFGLLGDHHQVQQVLAIGD